MNYFVFINSDVTHFFLLVFTVLIVCFFFQNCKQITDNMNLEDIRRFVESDFTEF